MVEVELTDELLMEAYKKANKLMHIKSNIDGNRKRHKYVGCLGEELVNSVLNFKWANTHTHDLKAPNGKTVEIKTQRCIKEPHEGYKVRVNAYSIEKQICDYYAFALLLDGNDGEIAKINCG